MIWRRMPIRPGAGKFPDSLLFGTHLLFWNDRGGCKFCARSRPCQMINFLWLLAVVVEAEVGDEAFAHDVAEGVF
jgi:hypothetical protein